MPSLTIEELGNHNGQKDALSYVAVDGEIYDVSPSPLWHGGHHMGHNAGGDLTEALSRAPHGREVFEKIKKIGVLLQTQEAADTTTQKIPPTWVSKLISLHSHPISVHFPQAFFVVAPLFLMLFYATGTRCLERTSYHLLCVGFLTAIPATATGFLHWWYKYSGRSRPVFRLKIILSLLLLPVGGLALALHSAWGPLGSDSINWTVLILYLVLIPLVVVLGRAGGLIVFSGKGR